MSTCTLEIKNVTWKVLYVTSLIFISLLGLPSGLVGARSDLNLNKKE